MIKRINCLILVAAAITAGCNANTEAELVSGVHLDAIDRSTRPQDDFYQFVNGGWLDSTEIPEIYSGYTVYHEVNERVEIALREIITGWRYLRQLDGCRGY
jgi:predicted metalloendopeptidase